MKSISRIYPYIIFTLFTFGAGLVNGLLGTGGGILLTFIISRVLHGKDYSPKDVFVCSMTAVIPICLVSLFTYSTDILPNTRSLLGIMLSAAIGGLLGAVLSDKLKSAVLEKGFALLIIYAGVRMLLR